MLPKYALAAEIQPIDPSGATHPGMSFRVNGDSGCKQYDPHETRPTLVRLHMNDMHGSLMKSGRDEVQIRWEFRVAVLEVLAGSFFAGGSLTDAVGCGLATSFRPCTRSRQL